MTELRDDDRTALVRDGWRVGSDQRWRNDRFGGAYKAENALRRIGSRRGEATRPMDDEETARFLKGYAAGANDMEAGRLVTKSEEGTGAYLTLAVESLEAEVESLREQLVNERRMKSLTG